MAFTLQVYRDLKQRLGYYDSITELNELAIRELIKKARNSADQQNYIKDLSKEHSIYVNFPSFPEELSVIMAKSYIVTIYQSAELFLRDYRKEHCDLYGNLWEYKEKGGSKLYQAITNTKASYSYESDLNCKIFEYYRLIRNNIVHPHIKKDISDIQKDLKKEESEIKKRFGVKNAPNKIEEISFEDFILFTKVTKEIGRVLCELAKPSPEELIRSIEKRFRKIRNNKEKLEKSISNDLRTKFSLTNEEVESILHQVDIMEII